MFASLVSHAALAHKKGMSLATLAQAWAASRWYGTSTDYAGTGGPEGVSVVTTYQILGKEM
eukprot:1145836-Pelagomonas_calceolata.AAC.3